MQCCWAACSKRLTTGDESAQTPRPSTHPVIPRTAGWRTAARLHPSPSTASSTRTSTWGLCVHHPERQVAAVSWPPSARKARKSPSPGTLSPDALTNTTRTRVSTDRCTTPWVCNTFYTSVSTDRCTTPWVCGTFYTSVSTDRCTTPWVCGTFYTSVYTPKDARPAHICAKTCIGMHAS
eukprot:302623-Chlamydomonas_euryale.AAC.1